MNSPEQNINFRVYLLNGRMHEYRQPDPHFIRDMFENLNPSRVFRQPQIMIAGSYSMSGFHSNYVTRIFVDSTDTPDWPMLQGLTELTEREFYTSYANLEKEQQTRVKKVTIGEELTAFAELELVCGSMLFLRIDGKVRHAAERGLQISKILTGPCLLARGSGDRGIWLINPTNIARFTLYPGPPTAPRNAWVAHRMRPNMGDSAIIDA